jgi:hypothetical protein
MYLVYMGESGDTGNSVGDPHQKHHVHLGLLVHEQQCISINGEFNALCRRHFGSPLGESGTPKELRAGDIYQGTGFFSAWRPEKRAELIQDCLSILVRRETPGIVAYIDKEEFSRARAREDSPYAYLGSPSEITISKFLLALNLFVDEANITEIGHDRIMEADLPIRNYSLVVAGQGKSVAPGFMNQFLRSENEIPSPAVLENFCYVSPEHSVCTQLANMCSYFVRRWLQNPMGTNTYFDVLQEGRVIQVIYPVQFY